MLNINTNKGQQKIKTGRNKIKMRAYEKDMNRRRTMTERKRDKRQKLKNNYIKFTAQSIREEGISEKSRLRTTSAATVPTLCRTCNSHCANTIPHLQQPHLAHCNVLLQTALHH